MKRIIDKRKKEKFMMDDKYLNGQARICGWQATLVYNSLCRHANINQESFPSIKLMTEELAVGRNTIIKGIKNLEKHNVIGVEKTRKKDGKWLNNSYILLDKSEWLNYQVPHKDTASQVPLRTLPCPSQNKTKSSTGTLRKHIEGNTNKETHNISNEILEAKPQAYGNTLINEILSYLKKKAGWIDGSVKNQRYGCNTFIKRVLKLLKEMGVENPNDKQVLDGCKRIIDLAAADNFHYKNMGKIKYLYDNIGTIVRSSKGKGVVKV